jgi:hypothetical protein
MDILSRNEMDNIGANLAGQRHPYLGLLALPFDPVLMSSILERLCDFDPEATVSFVSQSDCTSLMVFSFLVEGILAKKNFQSWMLFLLRTDYLGDHLMFESLPE